MRCGDITALATVFKHRPTQIYDVILAAVTYHTSNMAPETIVDRMTSFTHPICTCASDQDKPDPTSCVK